MFSPLLCDCKHKQLILARDEILQSVLTTCASNVQDLDTCFRKVRDPFAIAGSPRSAPTKIACNSRRGRNTTSQTAQKYTLLNYPHWHCPIEGLGDAILLRFAIEFSYH